MAKAAKERVESPTLGLGYNKRVIEGDRMLWIIFIVLVVISILVVYSSTAKMAYDVSSSMTTADSLRQQIMLVVMAIPLLFVIHKIDYIIYMYDFQSSSLMATRTTRRIFTTRRGQLVTLFPCIHGRSLSMRHMSRMFFSLVSLYLL